MNSLIEWLKLYKDSVYSIGIILTFAISSLSAYLTFKNNKAIHYVNSITKSRVAWINNLRDTIADFIAHTNIYNNVYYRKNYEKSGEYLSKCQKLCSKIKLLLNCCDQKDIEIVELTESILLNFRSYVDQMHNADVNDQGYIVESVEMKNYKKLVNEYIGQLNIKVQIYLKHEWNRVKYESQGKIYEKEVQQFDYDELEKQYHDKQYKGHRIQRIYIQIKCKLKKILFLPATYIIAGVLVALVLIA